MSGPLVQCMGGWGCPVRESCAHYHAPLLLGHQPSERLCGPLAEAEPVRVMLRAVPVEQKHEAA